MKFDHMIESLEEADVVTPEEEDGAEETMSKPEKKSTADIEADLLGIVKRNISKAGAEIKSKFGLNVSKPNGPVLRTASSGNREIIVTYVLRGGDVDELFKPTVKAFVDSWIDSVSLSIVLGARQYVTAKQKTPDAPLTISGRMTLNADFLTKGESHTTLSGQEIWFNEEDGSWDIRKKTAT